MVIIHIFIQTEIICFYTANPARIGLFRPHNDFPVPVYRRGRGGMLPASDSLCCVVKKPVPTFKMPFPPLCDFLFLRNNFSGISPCIFHGWTRKACLQSSYCVPCVGRIFVRNHTSVSEAFVLFG